jgi:hypothetical protein
MPLQPGPYLIQRIDHGFAVGPALPGGEPGEVDPRFICQDEGDARAAAKLPAILDGLTLIAAMCRNTGPDMEPDEVVVMVRQQAETLLTAIRGA